MSQENLELVEAAVEALNRRDFESLAAMCGEDFEFVSVFTALDAGTYVGQDAWRRYAARMDEAWDDWSVEGLRLFDSDDDRVAAVVRLVGTGKHSGVKVDRAVGLVYRLRAGELWRMRSYLEPGEALEAVGLPT